MARKIAPVLDEMLRAIAGIEASIAHKDFADFEKDWLLKHGVQRGIEIISEASRHLPARLKEEFPSIRWNAIAGIGNVLRHEYHAISDKVIWGVVTDELPRLKQALNAMAAGLRE